MLSEGLLPKRRREKTLAFHMVRELLVENGISKIFPLIDHNKDGQPLLLNLPYHLSISHCKDGICVAIDEYPIGIDIERVRPFNESLLNRAFSLSERQAILSAQDSNSEFIRLWTRKEAFLKQQGLGIRGFDQLQSVPPLSANLLSIQKENLWISICSQQSLSESEINAFL